MPGLGASPHGGGGDGTIVLVLVDAPSCAYEAAWTCPLPPAGNRVDAPVPVGERHPLRRAS